MTFQFRDDVERMSKADLLAYVGDLEAMLSVDGEIRADQALFNLMKSFGLTKAEGKLLLALSDGRLHSKEGLLTVMYGGSDDAPASKIVDVFVCKTRKKIAGSGIEIETMWGSGYSIGNTAPLKRAMAGEKVEWADGVKPAHIGKPKGARGRRNGSVRDAALKFLIERADNGVVRIKSRELDSACGGMGAATMIRQLEATGRLGVLEKPARGGVWTLLLTEKAYRL